MAVNKPDNDFLTRIQLALNMTSRDIAHALHISLDEVADRHGDSSEQSSGYSDPFWTALSHVVDERVGVLMGVREELNRKLRLDLDRRNMLRRKTLER